MTLKTGVMTCSKPLIKLLNGSVNFRLVLGLLIKATIHSFLTFFNLSLH